MTTDNRERDLELITRIACDISELRTNYMARIVDHRTWATSYRLRLERQVKQLTQIELDVLDMRDGL